MTGSLDLWFVFYWSGAAGRNPAAGKRKQKWRREGDFWVGPVELLERVERTALHHLYIVLMLKIPTMFGMLAGTFFAI